VQPDAQLGDARDHVGQGQENRFPKAVQRGQMHAGEQPVDEAHETAFDEKTALGQPDHQAAHGTVLAQQHQQTEVAIAKGRSRLARELPHVLADEKVGLLVRSLGGWVCRPLMSR
jgi:hypothetical protein